jgi:hypothetical protein
VTSLGWWLLNQLAHALEPAERDVVLGDFAESGDGLGAATRELMGLILRRQAALWTSWRPWLALFGVSCLAGLSLNRIALGLMEEVHRYSADYYTDLTDSQVVAFLSCLAVALLVWSWTCGFVLGSLSGRAAWLTWSGFSLVILHSAIAGLVLAGSTVTVDRQGHVVPLLRLLIGVTLATLPCSISALLGAFAGTRRGVLTVRQAYLVTVASATLTIVLTWATGPYGTAQMPARWPEVPWSTRLLPFLLASWPAVYLLAAACHAQNGNDRAATVGRGHQRATTRDPP